LTSVAPPEPQYKIFKGYKKSLQDTNKKMMLKMKKIYEKEANSLRYDYISNLSIGEEGLKEDYDESDEQGITLADNNNANKLSF
jgi:hypothetical protein